MAKTPGRPRYTWISQLEQDTGISADQLWNTAANRTEWAALRPSAGSRDRWWWWLTVPKMWRKTNILALVKPGKDPAQSKSYRPISLLCHTVWDSSFTDCLPLWISFLSNNRQDSVQVNNVNNVPAKYLNLIQYIEDGFENNQPTGEQTIRSLLENRCFDVDSAAHRVDGASKRMAYLKKVSWFQYCSWFL